MGVRQPQDRQRAEALRLIIAGNIRARRQELGLTQRELSSMLGAYESYIRALEHGTKEFSIVRLDEIAELLDVPMCELVEQTMKWEYKVVYLGWCGRDEATDELQTDLNNLGDDGWELVAVHGFPEIDKDQYTFKRRKRA